MQFELFGIKVKISFTFFALILLLFCFNKTEFLLYSMIFSFIHELGHLVAIKIFKINISQFSISIFGGNIVRDNLNMSNYRKDIFISFFGPFSNLLFFILFYFFDTVFPNSHFEKIYTINLCIALFNLLPFYSFDGGTMLSSLLKMFLSEKNTELIITIVSLLLAIPFSVFSVLLFLECQGDFHFLLLSIFMLLTLLFKK